MVPANKDWWKAINAKCAEAQAASNEMFADTSTPMSFYSSIKAVEDGI